MALSGIIKEVNFQVGDTIEVSQKVKEGDKTRIQLFRGLVIAIKGHGEEKSFTVRRIAGGGIGVERIWPLNSPWLSKIKVVKKGKTKRAKLYYLRKRVGKGATRVKSSEGKENEKEKLGKAGRKPSSKISSK